jgi:hypothetical protein
MQGDYRFPAKYFSLVSPEGQSCIEFLMQVSLVRVFHEFVCFISYVFREFVSFNPVSPEGQNCIEFLVQVTLIPRP